MGDLAYAVYLFHWIPVTVVAIACPYLGYPARYILTVVAVLVGSVVLFVLFDRPMEKLRHAFVKSRIKREVRCNPNGEACSQRMSAEQTELPRRYVEMNAESLAKANEALKLLACRYPINCSLLANPPLPHPAKPKTVALLYRHQAASALQREDKESASAAVEMIPGLACTTDKKLPLCGWGHLSSLSVSSFLYNRSASPYRLRCLPLV